MSKHELTPHQQLLSIRLAVWQSHAIATAAKLGLADALANGPLSLADIAQRTGADAPSLYRLLRALAGTGFFAETSQNVFGNTASSECLRHDVPGSQRDWVLWFFSDLDGVPQAWERLAETIKTGEAAFDKANGYNLWEHGRQHPESATRFNNAMRSGSEDITPAIAMAYDWHRFPVIADIAGGIGTQLVAILDNCPDSSGILFDQPHVGAQVIPQPRMQFASGDFFDSVPAGADAYLLRRIVHDWSDQRALDILKSVRRAMKPSARLILAEAIIPPGSEYDFSKWVDMLMLVLLAGRERTEAEFRFLLAAAGFKLENVIETGCPLKLVVASPV
jgi:hypothetical protein